jgi:putative copper resistance protein D
MAQGLPAWRVLAATVLVNIGLAGIVGAWASVLWLRVSASPWAVQSRRRSLAALNASLALTMVADVLLLCLQAAYMAEVPLADAFAMLPTMLEKTYVGHAWSCGVLGLLLVFVSMSRPALRQNVVRVTIAAIGISLFVYCRAAVSHAGDFGLASVQLFVEWTHLWAISLWLGVVGIAAFAVFAHTVEMTAADWADLAGWVQTLSATATAALIVVVGTGLFNSWRGVGSTANLMESAYGNTLLVKVGLVMVAAALGGFNRFRTMPRLMAALRAPLDVSARPQDCFIRVLRIEAVVLCAALIAAALLSSSPPPSST